MRVAIGCYDGSIAGWDVDVGFVGDAGNESSRSELVFAYKAHNSCVKCIAAGDMKGKYMSSGGTDDAVRVYDAVRLKELGALEMHEGNVNCVTFVGSKHMISGGEDGKLCMWRTSDWLCVHELKGHKIGPVTSIVPHPSGKLAFSTSTDNSLRLWNLMNGRAALGRE